MRRCFPFSHPPLPPSPDTWATSWCLNQANSAVQDGRGRKRMEEGRNEPWLLSWSELCPRDLLKQWALTAHVEILPQTVLTWCVRACKREREERVGIWLKRLDEVNHKWSQWGKAGAGRTKDMCHHTQEVFCYAVWLRKTGCWCSGAGEDGNEACLSLQRIYPLTPGE